MVMDTHNILLSQVVNSPQIVSDSSLLVTCWVNRQQTERVMLITTTRIVEIISSSERCEFYLVWAFRLLLQWLGSFHESTRISRNENFVKLDAPTAPSKEDFYRSWQHAQLHLGESADGCHLRVDGWYPQGIMAPAAGATQKMSPIFSTSSMSSPLGKTWPPQVTVQWDPRSTREPHREHLGNVEGNSICSAWVNLQRLWWDPLGD